MKQWLGLAFRDDAPMVGPPGCTAAHFKVPRLRRCPFDPEDPVFETRLGGGADGCVWKVRLGKERPFALKMFWDFEPPKSLRYWGVQRECQNAALLQMMETAVEQAVAAQRPVLVIPDPASHDDAKINQAAFCDEGRQHQPQLPTQHVRAITKIPRMRKCYGWLTLPRGLFDGTPSWLRPPCLTFGMKLKRFMQPDQEYPAILYEYVEDGENNPSKVQEALDFFWLAGFSATMSPLARNWKSNVLLDLSDIVPARGFGWKERGFPA
ncbi:hypothetical protein B0J18DRAFT_447188 [Chaetomium sp. MPI-SDFR-AT-0129]|nr:hypothetical protein B0J18DRAFT_447188 [Chaetomium sp. MPI-SDFR-AT-0129]